MILRLCAAMVTLAASLACAAPAVTRSFFTLPSSNGYGAVMVDARTAKVVHFRESLAGTEEPRTESMGGESAINARNVLFDAYFGVRAQGQQQWLTQTPISSGYALTGSGVITWRQTAGALEANTFVFAPRSMPHAAFVMALQLKNTGASAVTGLKVFSLHNFHLGFGRPGVMQDIGSNGETVVISTGAGAAKNIEERGFAGCIVTRPLGASRITAWNPASTQQDNAYAVVNAGGSTNFSSLSGDLGVADDWASAAAFETGTLEPQAEAWVAIIVAHHQDPFAGAVVSDWVDAYVGLRDAKALVADEQAEWAAFQASLTLPSGLSRDEENVVRQSAVVLSMSQVKQSQSYLREWLTRDGEPRTSRFSNSLPALITHNGAGAVLASLPPGEWTVSWPRDAAFAIAAMSTLKMTTQAREGLRFMLDAEGGRFKDWSELQSYGIGPYAVSLTRYTGFGVEETDFNGFGPNLEFDGFGLFLWALRQHELKTNDTTLADARFEDIATKVADPLVNLIDSSTGLLRADSSIWETHWNGRQRQWAFTNITAARGLCDAAEIAHRMGDETRAMKYRMAGTGLRAAIASRLVTATGAIASNREELISTRGFSDAAVFTAMTLGLFNPKGRIATASVANIEATLRVSAGPGWSRNDDLADHQGADDLSPWGSEYDSAEWAFTDLQGSMALRANAQTSRANDVVAWVTQNGIRNAGLLPETFDETTGAWKFNAPMTGFGAGAYVLAMAHRADGPATPACGAYFDEATDGGTATNPDAGALDAGVTKTDGGTPLPSLPSLKPCGCGSVEALGPLALAALVAALTRRLHSRA